MTISNSTKGNKTMNATESAKNGAKSHEKAETEAKTDSAESPEKVRRGVVPTMPMAILFKGSDSRVYAAIHHPVDGTSYVEAGKGEGSAKGALEDSGFRLSAVSMDGPDWLADKLPSGATLIGYASIKSFPLPVQSK